MKLTDWEAVYEQLAAADIPDPQVRTARVIALEAVFDQAVSEAFDTGVRFGLTSTTRARRWSAPASWVGEALCVKRF